MSNFKCNLIICCNSKTSYSFVLGECRDDMLSPVLIDSTATVRVLRVISVSRQSLPCGVVLRGSIVLLISPGALLTDRGHPVLVARQVLAIALSLIVDGSPWVALHVARVVIGVMSVYDAVLVFSSLLHPWN